MSNLGNLPWVFKGVPSSWIRYFAHRFVLYDDARMAVDAM